MTVTTVKGIWVVPPLRAVWIPALTDHQIDCSGKLSMRTLYIISGAASKLPEECCVVSVSPLLRELILHAVTLPRLYKLNSPEERIMNMILDLVQIMKIAPLDLPIPTDARLKKILESLRQLGREEQVTTVALDLGYNSPSAFIAMFKKALGKTPGQYFKEADS